MVILIQTFLYTSLHERAKLSKRKGEIIDVEEAS